MVGSRPRSGGGGRGGSENPWSLSSLEPWLLLFSRADCSFASWRCLNEENLTSYGCKWLRRSWKEQSTGSQQQRRNKSNPSIRLFRPRPHPRHLWGKLGCLHGAWAHRPRSRAAGSQPASGERAKPLREPRICQDVAHMHAWKSSQPSCRAYMTIFSPFLDSDERPPSTWTIQLPWHPCPTSGCSRPTLDFRLPREAAHNVACPTGH